MRSFKFELKFVLSIVDCFDIYNCKSQFKKNFER